MKFGSKEPAEIATNLVVHAEETGCFLDFEGKAAVRLASKYAGASNARAAKAGIVDETWADAHFRRADESVAGLTFADHVAACLWAEGRALEREFDVERVCFARIARLEAMHAQRKACGILAKQGCGVKHDILEAAKALAVRRCRHS